MAQSEAALGAKEEEGSQRNEGGQRDEGGHLSEPENPDSSKAKSKPVPLSSFTQNPSEDAGQATTAAQQVEATSVGKAYAIERSNILKLFLALHLAGILTGVALGALAKSDLVKGAGFGVGISSVNFGVSLALSSKSGRRQ